LSKFLTTKSSQGCRHEKHTGIASSGQLAWKLDSDNKNTIAGIIIRTMVLPFAGTQLISHSPTTLVCSSPHNSFSAKAKPGTMIPGKCFTEG